MTRRFPLSTTIAVLSALGSTNSLAAGGHFDVDDATILDPGHCQYETWATRSSSIESTLLHVGPACRVGPVELGATIDRAQGAREKTTRLGPQVKWVVDPVFERFSTGAAWSASFDLTHGGRPLQTFYVPATWWAAEKLWVHINVGADWSPSGSRTGRYGLSAEWAANDKLSLIAERITLSEERIFRLGARWSLTSSVSVDVSAARAGSHGSRVFAIGLNHDFAR